MTDIRKTLIGYGTLCLECLVCETGYHSGDVLRELDILGAELAEARCALCSVVGPAFSAS